MFPAICFVASIFRDGEIASLRIATLAGVKGIVVAEKGGLRIMIWIDLLQRSVLLEIAADRISVLSDD